MKNLIPVLFLATIIVIIGIFAIYSCSSPVKTNTGDEMKKFIKEGEEFRKKLETIKDDSLKKEMLSYTFGLFVEKQSDLETKDIPDCSEYTDNRLSVYSDYPSLTSLAETYIESLIPSLFKSYNGEVEISFIEPFWRKPLMADITYNKVFLKNQKSVPIITESQYNQLNVKNQIQASIKEMTFPTHIDMYYPENSTKPEPVSIDLAFKITIPSTIHQFQFSKSDIGKTQTQAGYTVKLLNIKNHYVEVELSLPADYSNVGEVCGFPEWFNIQAKDRSNQYISMSTSQSDSVHRVLVDDLYPRLVQQLEYTDDFCHSFIKDVKAQVELIKQERDTNKRYKISTFNGMIDKIEVAVLDYRNSTVIEKEKNYPIVNFYPEDKTIIPQVKTSAIIYDHEAEEMLKNNLELNEKDIASRVQLTQKNDPFRGNPKFKNDKIEIAYPKLLSSQFPWFSRVDSVKQLAFYDQKHKKITISPDSISWKKYSENNVWVDLKSSGIDYFPERFTTKPFYAKGIFVVNLAEIEKKSYSLANLPVGIIITGNTTIVDQAFFPQNKFLIYLQDNTGRYLKLIKEKKMANPAQKGKMMDVYYSYGNPEKIEVYTLKGSRKVDYPFDVELTGN